MQKRIQCILTILCVLTLFVSCKNKQKTSGSEIIEISDAGDKINKPHQWYAFSQTGYSQVTIPQAAPSVPAKPWTEAIRISSSSASSNEDGKTQEAFMIVNRLGIMSMKGSSMELNRDTTLFAERTAGNLVFVNGTPIYSLYKSTFFNNNLQDNQHPFLVQFDPSSKISYPLVNCDNLTDNKACEVTDFIWDGRTWFCCIKSEENSKTEFSYIKWTSNIPLLNQSPAVASENITISESDADTFRSEKVPLPFTRAPDRIKKLLNGMASKVPFNLTILTAGGTSPRHYSNVSKENEEALMAYGVVSESWSGIMFQDGTLYVEGALDGRRILRGGKAVALRLPRLPYGFNYTSFIISGSTLYAAWEESDFYMTSRSGFIKVDLDATLYKSIQS
ncbi:MAG: hypothetical protein MJ181_10650 [Treponema sp.]|nr:hypothetical protein [Treponema sp.]